MATPGEGSELIELLAAVRGGDSAARETLLGRLGVAARRRLGAVLRGDGTVARDILFGICDDIGCRDLKRAERSEVMAIGAAALRRSLVTAFARRTEDPQARYAVALDEALRSLHATDPTLATLVELAFFGGLEADEVAEIMGTSEATVERRWRFATAWLHRRIAGSTGG